MLDSALVLAGEKRDNNIINKRLEIIDERLKLIFRQLGGKIKGGGNNRNSDMPVDKDGRVPLNLLLARHGGKGVIVEKK